MHARCLFVPLVILAASSWHRTGRAEPPGRELREAVVGGLAIVQKAAASYPEHRKCFSCHHQTLPMLAMQLAGQKGVEIDAQLLQDQAEFTWQSFHSRREAAAEGRGIGGASMTVGYGLWALDIAKRKPDETTMAMVSFLLKQQAEDGSWTRSSNRPPLEESNVTCTILAVYYMGKFAADAQRGDVERATERARAWLLASTPVSHEDRVSRLGALALVRADQSEADKARQEVLAAQRDDGGWSQLADLESDAYATGLTLFTLQRTGLATSDEAFQRGVRFLLETQCDDGSWWVKTRSKPIQQFFDNGDPHGEDQFISVAATSWATAALALALPPAN